MRRLPLDRLRFLVLGGAVVLGCTKLDDPNDYFISGTGGGPGSSTGGSAANDGASSTGGAGNELDARPDTSVATSGGAPGAGGGSTGGHDSGTPGSDGASSGGATNSGGTSSTGGTESTGGAVSTGGTSSGGASGTGGDGCNDPAGFDGVGCYRCTPKDITTLENACSDSDCTVFEEAFRLTKLTVSGDLPPLPAPGGGSGGATGTGGTSASGGAASGGGTTGAGGATGSGGAPPVVGVPCDELEQRGKVVYVTGSSASKPFLQQIAQQLSAQKVFLVYTSTGSCVGVDAVLNGTPMVTGLAPAPATSATYWDTASSTGTACDLPSDGVPADLGISDVFAQSCAGFELASLSALGVRDSHGPIQTMTFVVPFNSSYSEISARAAYFVFGFGADGGVLDPTNTTPIWNDPAYVFIRSATSGTQSMLAAAIGVPPGSWKGKSLKASGDVAAAIQTAGTTSKEAADKAIGILAADYIDSNNLRAQIRVLAYEDTLQHCAMYPDSTSSARDKRNVRDGHYPIWGPLHLFYKVDEYGNPVNQAKRQVLTDILGYLSGTKPLPNGVKLINVYAQSGLVPECAMRVTRTKDGGNITPQRPDTPCSCLFDKVVTGTTTCKQCVVQGDCAPGETCSLGYCEPP